MINFMIFFIGINHISAAPIQSVNGDEINNTKIQISNLLEKTAKIFLEKIKNEYLNFKAEDEIKTGKKNCDRSRTWRIKSGGNSLWLS